MLCPKCNKEMKIMTLLDLMILQDGSECSEVLGRCEDCDFDATWETVTDMNGRIEEFNFERYFFG
jgi:hypothetical protein